MTELPHCWITDESPTEIAPDLVGRSSALVERDQLPTTPYDLSQSHLYVAAAVTAGETVEDLFEAASRGVSLVLKITGGHRARAMLVDELRRVTILLSAEAPSVADPITATLTTDQLLLLRMLEHGATVAEAATSAGLSTRTAHRRLAAAAESVGGRSTTETIRIARQTGLLSDDGSLGH